MNASANQSRMPARRHTQAWLLLLLTLAGCDLGAAFDTADSFDPVIQIDPADVQVAGLMLDSRTGSPLKTETVLSFSGDVGHLVQNVFGHSIQELAADRGAASFAIANTVDPGPGRPIEVRIHARAAGYRPTSVRLSILGPGLHEFRMLMDPVEHPVASRSFSRTALLLSGGILAQPAVITALDLGFSVASAALPAGARLLSGTRVGIEGVLNAQLAYTPPSEELFATFPGGLDSGLLMDDDSITPATFTTGGLVSLSGVTQSGETWRALDGEEIAITATVNATLFNPKSNEAIRAGDVVEVHEWVPGYGAWRLLEEVAVSEDASGLAVGFSTPRTGHYSIGYRTVHCSAGRLRLTNNSLGGALVAYQGDRNDSDGMRIWRFSPGATEVALEDPPDFWRGTVYVQHGNQTIEIPYDGICGRTFEADLVARPLVERRLILEPSACTALRVTELPTLAVAISPLLGIPLPALEALVAPPIVRSYDSITRDNLGRPIRITATAGTNPGGASLRLILGGQAWDFSLVDLGKDATVDISRFAIETGLCVHG